ncbi:hypothetical protein HYX13_03525 [Candidatus Woesearchaeota archaeon]|nr:hypothetical protein [Candidatus Woesearchaeota archaeon]
MIANVHHTEDPDGIIAGALLNRYQDSRILSDPKELHLQLKSLAPASLQMGIRYDSLVESFSSLLENVQRYGGISQIYVADINPNPRLMQSGLIEKLAQSTEIFWIDHHTGTEQQQEYFSQLGIQVTYDASKCASLLLARKFNMTDTYEQRLAKIAQLHDYRDKEVDSPEAKLGVELEKIICLANAREDTFTRTQLMDDLRRGYCFSKETLLLLPHWQQNIQEYDQEKNKAIQELEKSIESVTVGKYQILIARAPALLSQKPAIWYLKQKDPDVLLCFFQPPCRNHIMDKRKNIPLDIPALCTGFGGGGRGTGGGFAIAENMTPELYVRLKEEVLQKIKEQLCKK